MARANIRWYCGHRLGVGGCSLVYQVHSQKEGKQGEGMLRDTTLRHNTINMEK